MRWLVLAFLRVSMCAVPPKDAPPSNVMCPGNTVGCFLGHLRHCQSKTMKQSDAMVVRRCAQGCKSCPDGVPDTCNMDRFGADICGALALVRPKNCSLLQTLHVGCLNDGPHIRYCFGGKIHVIEFCGAAGCKGSSNYGQCNAVRWVPPPTPSRALAPSTKSAEMCSGNQIICWKNHIRLCAAETSKDLAQVIHDCRSQGCTACAKGPHLCNDALGKSVCDAASAVQGETTCNFATQRGSFCDKTHVRRCGSNNRGVLVEFCAKQGCQSSPAQCVRTPSAAPRPAPSTPTAASPTVKRPAPSAPAPTAKSSPTAPSPAASNASCSERIRREWGSMPEADRVLFVRGLNTLYARGDMTAMAQFHYDNRDFIHGNGIIHFLIWHRVFVMDLEEKIRALPGFGCVTIPYWNYDFSNSATARANRRSVFGTAAGKLGQAERGGCIGGVFSSFTHSLEGMSSCIQRLPNPQMMTTLGNSVFIDLCQIGDNNFMTFAGNLQTTHGVPHVSGGGTFSSHFSPIDPLFFVHHSNIDRIFDMWQDCHNNYEWPEFEGLRARIRDYPGVTAGDFIDNHKTLWKGRTYKISYSSDQFDDASVYSADFRRSILTRCFNGRFRRYRTPQPILGLDDQWARDSFRSSNMSGGGGLRVNLTEQTVPLRCESATGTSLFNSLNPISAPLAVFDNLGIQECASRCSVFYWKLSGDSNCVCITISPWGGSTASLSGQPSVRRFLPTCDGPEGQFALFRIVQQSTGRRLLQLEESLEEDENMTDSSENATDSSENATDSSGENATDSSENATDSSENATDSSENATDSSENATDSSENELDSEESDEPIPTTDTDTNATANNTTRSLNLTAPTPGSPVNATKLCFNVPPAGPPRAAPAEIACSTSAVKPPPLPREWLLMNKLSLEVGDMCKTFKPAVGSLSVDCLNQ